jgi:putative membrane protein
MHLARRAALALGVAVAAALALPAAASAAPAAPSASVSAADRTWMVAAHQSNLTEIAAGKAAQQKATSQKVRDLGQMFITDHSANDAKLKAAANDLGFGQRNQRRVNLQSQAVFNAGFGCEIRHALEGFDVFRATVGIAALSCNDEAK